MRLASIHTYPIKGCRGLDHDAALVEPWGLAGDRRWLLVEPDGRALTQRTIRALTGIRPRPRSEGGLLVRAAGAADLEVPEPAGDLVDVTVGRSTLAATAAGDAADRWFGEVLDRKVRLVWLDDPTRRPTDPEFSAPTDRVSFADAYPLLLTNRASLDALNGWILEAGALEPLPMNRFRPNVVVGGAEPWAEDAWLGRRIRIGEVAFRAVKACSRCVVTTTDQETGERGTEPLRTLSRHRKVGSKVYFGMNLIPERPGRIAVGDPIALDLH